MKTSESKYCNCLYFTSSSLARKVEKLAIESWKKINLSPSHGYLLKLVINNPGIQPGNLADELQLTPSTITRLIEKLEEKKLIVRTSDGRSANVYPTPGGKNLLPKINDCMKNFYESYSIILGKDESKRLVTNMHKLVDKL